MPGGEPEARERARVVVGVDGSGRTHRLGRLAAAHDRPALLLSGDRTAGELATALNDSPDRAVLLDDAHRLSADALAPLLTAARAGRLLALARRPSLEPAGLAELERVAEADQIETLTPLDRAAVAGLLTAATGHAAPADLVTAILAASAGLPVFAVALARSAAERSTDRATGEIRPAGESRLPAAALARVQRSLAAAGPDATALARTMALDPDLDDLALADAAQLPAERLPAAARALRDAGLLRPGRERLVPVVAAAVLAEQTGAERRAGHHRVARARAAAGSAPEPVAAALWAARVRTPEAAERYLAAAEALLWTDPLQAWSWLDRAAEADGAVEGAADGAAEGRAGAERAWRRAAARAETAVLLGRPTPEPPVGTGVDDGPDRRVATRLSIAAAVADIQQGRVLRGGTALAGTGPLGAALAAPSLVAAGRVDLATGTPAAPVPIAVTRLAEAVIACAAPGPAGYVPLLIDAVETAGRTRPAVLWPDTPHALTALAAVAAGDAGTAEHALGCAWGAAPARTDGAQPDGADPGGRAAGRRHQLLLAWVRLRTGRYDTAVDLLRHRPDPRDDADGSGPVRDRLLRVVLSAGLARRRGDVAAMRGLWPEIEPLLARRAVDLFGLEPLEELLVVAARLRRPERVHPLLEDLDAVVARLGRPQVWLAALGWLQLQVAVAGDDADRAATVAGALVDLAAPADAGAAGTRPTALAAAAACWADLLADRVDPDPVLAAVDGLAGPGQLPWEAGQLAGQAAIRCTDARLTRRLLERARELSNAETAAPATDDGRVGALSEREAEVARLVLAGRTHREIGSQLFISAKTVEHHVAKIRTKLGVQTRAEFVAALRALLADDSPGGGIRSPIGDS